MHAGKITSQEALVIAKEEFGVSVTLVTMHEWCKKGVGTKIAGRWYVNTKRLKWLLEGKEWTTIKEAQKREKKNL